MGNTTSGGFVPQLGLEFTDFHSYYTGPSLW